MPKLIMMAYIRKKKVKGKTYYYIVEGVYEDQKDRPKQKVIKYLGNIESILKRYDFWDKHH